MPRTAPPTRFNSGHGAVAAWSTTTALPRRSTVRSSPTCPSAPHGFSRFRRAPARASPALGGHPRAQAEGRARGPYHAGTTRGHQLMASATL